VINLTAKDVQVTNEADEADARDGTFFFGSTDSKCANPRLGRLLGGYLGDALSAPKKKKFEDHLDDCLSCDLVVSNWFQLRQALRRPIRR